MHIFITLIQHIHTHSVAVWLSVTVSACVRSFFLPKCFFFVFFHSFSVCFVCVPASVSVWNVNNCHQTIRDTNCEIACVCLSRSLLFSNWFFRLIRFRFFVFILFFVRVFVFSFWRCAWFVEEWAVAAATTSIWRTCVVLLHFMFTLQRVCVCAISHKSQSALVSFFGCAILHRNCHLSELCCERAPQHFQGIFNFFFFVSRFISFRIIHFSFLFLFASYHFSSLLLYSQTYALVFI